MAQAEATAYGLVVVPPAGRNAWQRMIKGSRVATVVREVHCPVLVARRPPPQLDRILAAVSGGAATEEVVAAAAELARGLNGHVDYLHVTSEVALPFEPHEEAPAAGARLAAGRAARGAGRPRARGLHRRPRRARGPGRRARSWARSRPGPTTCWWSAPPPSASAAASAAKTSPGGSCSEARAPPWWCPPHPDVRGIRRRHRAVRLGVHHTTVKGGAHGDAAAVPSGDGGRGGPGRAGSTGAGRRQTHPLRRPALQPAAPAPEGRPRHAGQGQGHGLRRRGDRGDVRPHRRGVRGRAEEGGAGRAQRPLPVREAARRTGGGGARGQDAGRELRGLRLDPARGQVHARTSRSARRTCSSAPRKAAQGGRAALRVPRCTATSSSPRRTARCSTRWRSRPPAAA